MLGNTARSSFDIYCYDCAAFGCDGAKSLHGGCMRPERPWYAEDWLGIASFTGEERDSETNLDYFGTRYMSSAQGRWTSPDAINLTEKRILNPSNTLNKYIYGENNNRYYDPARGRFYYGGPGGLRYDWQPNSRNRYAYTEGDPVNYKDPNGLFIVPPDCPDFYDPTDPGDCGGCGGGGWGGGGGTIGGPVNPPITIPPGGGGGGGGTPPPQPQCFAQLKYRPVNDPTGNLVGGTHSFWWVQASNGQEDIISAGPQGTPQSHLNVWVTPGNNNGSGDSLGASTYWASALSSGVCDAVQMMLNAAFSFPSNSYPYDPAGQSGPNSNSAAHYFGISAGWGGYLQPGPPGSYGWNVPIVRIRPPSIPSPPSHSQTYPRAVQ